MWRVNSLAGALIFSRPSHSTRARTHTHTHTHTHAHEHTHVHTHIHTHAHTRRHIHTYAGMQAVTHTATRTHARTKPYREGGLHGDVRLVLDSRTQPQGYGVVVGLSKECGAGRGYPVGEAEGSARPRGVHSGRRLGDGMCVLACVCMCMCVIE